MRAYISIVRMRFYLLLQYRLAAWVGSSAQLLYGFVRLMVFYALYRYSNSPQPMTYAQVVTYTWISQAMIGILPWSGEPEVQQLVRSGNVAYELCRPISLYKQWFCRSLAFRSAPTLLKAIPVFAVAVFLVPDKFQLGQPNSLASVVAWLLATAGALLLSTVITNFANIVMLWTVSGEGIVRLIPAIVNVFSGVLFPLPFYPRWMQGMISFLPFRGLVDTPVRFYTGQIPPADVISHVGHQVLWSIGLILFSQWLLNRRMNKIIVQGG